MTRTRRFTTHLPARHGDRRGLAVDGRVPLLIARSARPEELSDVRRFLSIHRPTLAADHLDVVVIAHLGDELVGAAVTVQAGRRRQVAIVRDPDARVDPSRLLFRSLRRELDVVGASR